jgi:hypothetical protein
MHKGQRQQFNMLYLLMAGPVVSGAACDMIHVFCASAVPVRMYPAAAAGTSAQCAVYSFAMQLLLQAMT